MINIIAAMTMNRVIGKNNRLPWNISDDLKNFKRLTSGNTVIMGRKTFESIGRPLPNRNNIVLTSSMPETKGVIVCKTLGEAVIQAKEFGKEIFIIGGAGVYEQFLSLADRMYISYVKKDYEGDVLFPEFDEKDWVVESEQDFSEFKLVTFKRGKPKEV